MIERLAFSVLAVFAIVMAYSVAATAERFGNATESFDLVEFELPRVDYNGPDEPLEIALEIRNPSSHAIEVVEIDFAFRANGSSVGGGNLRPEVEVPARRSSEFALDGRISQTATLEDLEPGEEIRWDGTGRVLVSVDDAIDPEWINFSFRWVTP